MYINTVKHLFIHGIIKHLLLFHITYCNPENVLECNKARVLDTVYSVK